MEILEKSENEQPFDEASVLLSVLKDFFPSFSAEDFEKAEIEECVSALVYVGQYILDKMMAVPYDETESEDNDEESLSLSDLLFQVICNLCKEFTGLNPLSLAKEKFEDVMSLFCDVRRTQIRSKKNQGKSQNKKHYEKRNGKIRCYVPVKD